jgi:hypothetical protein
MTLTTIRTEAHDGVVVSSLQQGQRHDLGPMRRLPGVSGQPGKAMLVLGLGADPAVLSLVISVGCPNVISDIRSAGLFERVAWSDRCYP